MPEPLCCDVCEKRILRGKGLYREHTDHTTGVSFVRHYACEPFKIVVQVVQK